MAKGLGLDLATQTGWALGERTGRPLSGEWKFPGFKGNDRPHSCAAVYSSVKTMVQANGVEWVAIEAPVVGIMRKNKRGITTPTSAHGDLSLAMFSGAAQGGAIAGGAKHIWLVRPNEWRAAVLGNGYPKNPKAAAFQYCKLMGWWVDPKNENAAEALCVMAWGFGKEKLL